MRGRARGRAAFCRRRADVLSDGRCAVRRSASPPAGRRTTKDWLHTSQPSIEMRLCCPADKPFLLCGLLALYCLHKQYFAHDFSQDSDSAVAQVGFMTFALALMTVAAVADAIAEVEVCVRTPDTCPFNLLRFSFAAPSACSLDKMCVGGLGANM